MRMGWITNETRFSCHKSTVFPMIGKTVDLFRNRPVFNNKKIMFTILAAPQIATKLVYAEQVKSNNTYYS